MTNTYIFSLLSDYKLQQKVVKLINNISYHHHLAVIIV